MQLKEVLVVLGSPNAANGELSEIAKSRLNLLIDLYAPGKLILCTGGWGPHFNTAAEPHATYAKRYLLEKGIPEAAFLDSALSSNTVEDAVKSKQILSPLDDPLITVITSDYHLNRVKLIFGEIFNGFSFQCVGVNADFLSNEQRLALEAHEKSAVQSILQNGLYY